MRISEKQAQELFPNLPSKTKSGKKIKAKYSYEESKTQIAFVSTFREMQDKGLFATIPGLKFIELQGQPQFFMPMKTPQQREKAIIRGVRNKAMGYFKGWPDIEIIWKFEGKNHRTAYIETKTLEGALSDDQKILHERFHEASVPVIVMRKHAEGMSFLKRLGLLPATYGDVY